MMRKMTPAANPDAYVKALAGWQRKQVEALRKTVRATMELEEQIKWGHLVYFSNGPLLLIRAEEQRVLLGFWRGQRLQTLEPRLKSGGKYEMATLVLDERSTVPAAMVRRLTEQAVALNDSLGDPTRDAAPAKKKARPRVKSRR
ncbi:MAG: DUF1801 domain-containing protein [Povalibacter sp.]